MTPHQTRSPSPPNPSSKTSNSQTPGPKKTSPTGPTRSYKSPPSTPPQQTSAPTSHHQTPAIKKPPSSARGSMNTFLSTSSTYRASTKALSTIKPSPQPLTSPLPATPPPYPSSPKGRTTDHPWSPPCDQSARAEHSPCKSASADQASR